VLAVRGHKFPRAQASDAEIHDETSSHRGRYAADFRR
jgi:hypothetical protein